MHPSVFKPIWQSWGGSGTLGSVYQQLDIFPSKKFNIIIISKNTDMQKLIWKYSYYLHSTKNMDGNELNEVRILVALSKIKSVTVYNRAGTIIILISRKPRVFVGADGYK